jgi:hypothetical protein
MALLDRALRLGEAKQFKQFEKRVARINDFEPELELESSDELRARMDVLREQARNGAKLDDLLPAEFCYSPVVIFIPRLSKGNPVNILEPRCGFPLVILSGVACERWQHK